MRRYLLFTLIIVLLNSCSVTKHKDIQYLKDAYSDTQPTLTVFTPKAKANTKKAPVLVFVHGGNWDSGKKEWYSFFGRNFAKKGITTVVVGYTLSPEANYEEMTLQVAKAILWTRNHIGEYNGDSSELFLTGHSAGGHLISLAALNPAYGIDAGDISGIILNDAAGLDMHYYLQHHPPTTSNHYITTWSNDPEKWKKASPIFYLSYKTPPLLIYLGEKTYPSIKTANNRFLRELQTFQPTVTPLILEKKHIAMMTQYIWPWSNRYEEIIEFIQKTTAEKNHINAQPH